MKITLTDLPSSMFIRTPTHDIESITIEVDNEDIIWSDIEINHNSEDISSYLVDMRKEILVKMAVRPGGCVNYNFREKGDV